MFNQRTEADQVEFYAKLIKDLPRMISHAQASIEKFKKHLDEDPVYAFTWADEHFQAAARFRIYSDLLANIQRLESDLTVGPAVRADIVCDHIDQQANYLCKQLSNSSSKSANLMNDYLRVVWCELAQRD